MDYSLERLYDLEKDLDKILQNIKGTIKVNNVDQLSQSVLMKQTKDILVGFVKDLANVSRSCKSVLQSAAAKIDELKSDQVSNQKKLIEMQDKLINSKNEQLSEVTSEIKTWSDVVKKNPGKAVSEVKIKQAVKSVAVEDDRSKCFMIFGEKEEDCDQANGAYDVVQDIIEQIGEPKTRIMECYRVGKERPGYSRPIKVKLCSKESVQLVLSKANKLRTADKRVQSTYLAPDRTKEERIAHKKLVDDMRKKIKDEPGKYHFIRNKQLCSSEKKPTTSSEETDSNNKNSC